MDVEKNVLENIFYEKLSEIKPFQSFTLLRNLNDEQLAKFKLNSNKLPGTEIIPSFSRNILFGESIGSTIGYLGFASKQNILNNPKLRNFNDQQIGLTGIENEFDEELKACLGIDFEKMLMEMF